MNGFLNVIKPVGATASDVVVCLKRCLHQPKIGHLGTLDPGAAGVLPIAVGSATKLFNLLTNKKKKYRAVFKFGITTDTLDSYGRITETSNVIPDESAIRNALSGLLGEIEQVPPIYSALSVNGVRAYKLARNGEQVELKRRKVTVYSFDLLYMIDQSTVIFDIECSGGTYIRSLARDLAVACGSVGYMAALIRLSSGCFDIADAYTMDEIKEKKEACLLSVTYPIEDLPIYEYDDKYFDDINFGRKVSCNFDDYHRIFCKGTFFGVGKSAGGKLDLEFYMKNSL